MGVEVYIVGQDELHRVTVELGRNEGIEISGVSARRSRALRDRIYALARSHGVDIDSIRVVVVPELRAQSTEGIEVAALIASHFGREKPVLEQNESRGDRQCLRVSEEMPR